MSIKVNMKNNTILKKILCKTFLNSDSHYVFCWGYEKTLKYCKIWFPVSIDDCYKSFFLIQLYFFHSDCEMSGNIARLLPVTIVENCKTFSCTLTFLVRSWKYCKIWSPVSISENCWAFFLSVFFPPKVWKKRLKYCKAWHPVTTVKSWK